MRGAGFDEFSDELCGGDKADGPSGLGCCHTERSREMRLAGPTLAEKENGFGWCDIRAGG
jgi:hypothetical protein